MGVIFSTLNSVQQYVFLIVSVLSKETSNCTGSEKKSQPKHSKVSNCCDKIYHEKAQHFQKEFKRRSSCTFSSNRYFTQNCERKGRGSTKMGSRRRRAQKEKTRLRNPND